jgi:hypothetical protein
MPFAVSGEVNDNDVFRLGCRKVCLQGLEDILLCGFGVEKSFHVGPAKEFPLSLLFLNERLDVSRIIERMLHGSYARVIVLTYANDYSKQIGFTRPDRVSRRVEQE